MNAWYSTGMDRYPYPECYSYGNSLDFYRLFDGNKGDADEKRLKELYPLMARRLRPYVEEICDGLEYEGSMMYDEYPDQLSLLKNCREIWERARQKGQEEQEIPEWEELKDLISVLLLQEIGRRRKKHSDIRKGFQRYLY